jgi:hypothetical protein
VRTDGRANLVPVDGEARRRQGNAQTARAGKPNGRFVGVVGGIEDQGFVTGADAGLDGGVDGLGRPQRDGDGLRRFGAIRQAPVAPLQLRRDGLLQRRHPLHRSVLIVPVAHRGADQLRDARIDGVVRKALAEIDGAELARTPRHDGEDRRTDVGQLAAHGLQRTRADGSTAAASAEPTTPAWPANCATRISAGECSSGPNEA